MAKKHNTQPKALQELEELEQEMEEDFRELVAKEADVDVLDVEDECEGEPDGVRGDQEDVSEEDVSEEDDLEGLEDLDKAFQEFDEFLKAAERVPTTVDRRQAVRELTQTLERARRIVSDLRTSETATLQARRTAIGAQIMELERQLSDVRQRLKSLRQALKTL